MGLPSPLPLPLVPLQLNSFSLTAQMTTSWKYLGGRRQHLDNLLSGMWLPTAECIFIKRKVR